MGRQVEWGTQSEWTGVCPLKNREVGCSVEELKRRIGDFMRNSPEAVALRSCSSEVIAELRRHGANEGVRSTVMRRKPQGGVKLQVVG